MAAGQTRCGNLRAGVRFDQSIRCSKSTHVQLSAELQTALRNLCSDKW